jgi:putative peptide maturation system protein
MSQLSDYVAAEVNGETIRLHDVVRAAKVLQKTEFLEYAEAAAIFRQAALEHGITVTDEELQQAADEYRAERGLEEVADTEAWLAKRHLSLSDLEAVLRDMCLQSKLQGAMFNGKVDAHFAQNQVDYESATISRIVVGDEALANELAMQIRDDDADFYAAARKHSTEAETRRSGGYVGTVRRGDLSGAEQSAVFGAPAGTVVGPIRGRKDWRLIKVEELHPAALDADTRETIQRELFGQWFVQQRRSARIREPLLEEV